MPRYDNILRNDRQHAAGQAQQAGAGRASTSTSRSSRSTRWARSRTAWPARSSSTPNARGELKPGQTVIEATSGNTGIGLAMVCAQKGYPLVVMMAENFSVERRKLLRFLGARVVLTPAAEKGTGMLNKAVELAEQHGWFLCRQFENEANAEVHTRTTAQEILADFEGETLHDFVSGFGTGGTLLGVARGLKAADAGIRVDRGRARQRARCSAAASRSRATRAASRRPATRSSGRT